MKGEKHKRILRAAEALFNRFGIKKTAVDDIATAARVAKGTIYNNFGSKEGVLGALLREKTALFEKGIESALKSLKDPLEALKYVLVERLAFIHSSPFLSDRIVRVDEMTFNSLARELDRLVRGAIARILDSHLRGIVSKSDRKRMLDTLVYQFRGIEQTLWCAVEAVDPKKIEHDLDYLIRMIIPARAPERK